MTENSIAQLSADPDNHNQAGNATAEKMKSNSSDGETLETGAKSKAEQATAGAHSSPKKRRKVNHGKKSLLRCVLQGRGQSDTALSSIQARGHANLNRHACSLRLLSPIGKLRSSALGTLGYPFFLSIYYFLFEHFTVLGMVADKVFFSRGTAYDLRFGTTFLSSSLTAPSV